MKRFAAQTKGKLMERKSHWENVYTTKQPTEVSWYQAHAEKSLELIARTRIGEAAQIIDVGGGASTLVDDLLARNFQNITVLDISAAAIEKAKARLGEQAQQVTWLEADITQAVLPTAHYDVWHDRAVFHFLIDAKDRQSYVERIKRSLKQGGHLIVATFASDGPLRCSGLEIVRYSQHELLNELGSCFELIEAVGEDHPTPSNTTQKFIYHYLRKREGLF